MIPSAAIPITEYAKIPIKNTDIIPTHLVQSAMIHILTENETVYSTCALGVRYRWHQIKRRAELSGIATLIELH